MSVRTFWDVRFSVGSMRDLRDSLNDLLHPAIEKSLDICFLIIPGHVILQAVILCMFIVLVLAAPLFLSVFFFFSYLLIEPFTI